MTRSDELFERARCNQWLEARGVQDRINELIALVLRYPLIAAVKEILTWNGIHAGPCVGPRRRRLTEEERTRLRADLMTSAFAYLADS